MGYWGWRPLLLCVFLSVWVVSCSSSSDASTSVILPPTDLPPITLTVREPTHIITEAPPGLPTAATIVPTSSPSMDDDDDDPTQVYPVSSDVPRLETPTPLPLNLPNPLCFETTEGGILCLGRVDNPLRNNVQRAAVRVDLFQTDGTLLDQRETLLEQRLIPAGESAPYHALFPGGEEQGLYREFGNASPHLLRAEWASRDAGPPLVHIDTSTGRFENGWYVVDVEVTNLDEEEATRLRLVVTLYNDNEQVMGYRVVETNTIGPQKTTSIRVEVLPQVQGTSLRHSIHVEAQR
jgi:hypothetical protein